MYAIADETVFALCETVCGALQQSVAELAQLLDAASAAAGGAIVSGAVVGAPAPVAGAGAVRSRRKHGSGRCAALGRRQPVVPAARRLRRRQPVVVRDRRRLPGLADPAPGGRARVGEPPMSPAVGPIGRLGRFTATHVRAVVLAWVAIAVVFGAFAPRVETALSGAGWQANGSQSVQARSRHPEALRRSELGRADGGRALRAADRIRPRLRRRRHPGGADPALRPGDRLGHAAAAAASRSPATATPRS